jgi:predicted metal-dependent phosphoesterase TrpH
LKKVKKADLHVHTNFSDGTFSPREAVLEAKKRDIDCIAICDHDCVDALGPAGDIGAAEGIEVIPAVELTAENQGCEVHIIGYYIDPHNPQLLEVVQRMQTIRVERIHAMVERLKKVDVIIDPDEVFQISGKGSVGRLHLAYALHQNGYTRYVGEAFRLYIGEGKPCYVGKFNMTPAEAFDVINRAGGISVLAHPGVIGQDGLISEYKKYGLKGIEVYHTDHKPAVTARYLKLAQTMGLLVTGGSDCHGHGKGKILLGSVKVDYAFVEQLKKAAGRL